MKENVKKKEEVTILQFITEEFRDEKNRKVRLIIYCGRMAKYYQGPDVQGVIMEDERGEYVVRDGQKRYWRGIIEPVSPNIDLDAFREISLVILKPDALKMGRDKELIQEIENAGMEILLQVEARIGPDLVYRLYPYFFAPDWEKELVDYMSSGPSLCILVRTRKFRGSLKKFRNDIRERYGNYGGQSQIVNPIHISDSKEDTARETLLFFSPEEIRKIIG